MNKRQPYDLIHQVHTCQIATTYNFGKIRVLKDYYMPINNFNAINLSCRTDYFITSTIM